MIVNYSNWETKVLAFIKKQKTRDSELCRCKLCCKFYLNDSTVKIGNRHFTILLLMKYLCKNVFPVSLFPSQLLLLKNNTSQQVLINKTLSSSIMNQHISFNILILILPHKTRTLLSFENSSVPQIPLKYTSNQEFNK